jgi:hypothetical protein
MLAAAFRLERVWTLNNSMRTTWPGVLRCLPRAKANPSTPCVLIIDDGQLQYPSGKEFALPEYRFILAGGNGCRSRRGRLRSGRWWGRQDNRGRQS